MQKILIVDDDASISELIALYLKKEMFRTMEAPDGETALEIFRDFSPDLVILDLMLPGIDGYEVLRRMRNLSNVPVIMLSAKGETFDKVLGLELGADDYMVKPFDSKELTARVKAVLRRFSQSMSKPMEKESHKKKELIEYPDLLINKADYSVVFKGQPVEMPPKELELLFFLASSPNHVFTRDQLLDNIWGYDFLGDSRTVDVHVKRLREKLSGSPLWEISTVWGIGYKFRLTLSQ